MKPEHRFCEEDHPMSRCFMVVIFVRRHKRRVLLTFLPKLPRGPRTLTFRLKVGRFDFSSQIFPLRRRLASQIYLNKRF